MCDIVEALLAEYTADDAIYFSNKTGLKLGTAKGEEMECMRIAGAMKERGLDIGLIAEATKLSTTDTNEDVDPEFSTAELMMERRKDAARFMIREGARIGLVVNVLELPIDALLKL